MLKSSCIFIFMFLVFTGCQGVVSSGVGGLSEAEARALIEQEVRNICVNAEPGETATQLDRSRRMDAKVESEHWQFQLGDNPNLVANVFASGLVSGPFFDFIDNQCN